MVGPLYVNTQPTWDPWLGERQRLDRARELDRRLGSWPAPIVTPHQPNFLVPYQRVVLI